MLEPAGRRGLRFDVACSKGTYVRVLAEDIGAALGSVAHLEALRRTGFGRFDCRSGGGARRPGIARRDRRSRLASTGPRAPARRRPRRCDAAAAVRQGKAWVLATIAPSVGEDAAALLDPDGDVVAVVGPRGRALGTTAGSSRPAQLYIEYSPVLVTHG